MSHLPRTPRPCRKTQRATRIVALGLAVVLAACTSAAEHFEAGMGLEARGDIIRAADRYISALDQDEELVEARERLEDLTPRVVGLYLERIEDASERGSFVPAADMIPDLDDFIEDARGVGVIADPGPDYRGFRRTVHDNAIQELLGRSALNRRDGRFREALRALERIARYEPRLDDDEAVRRGVIDTRMSWARYEFNQGRFQASFQQAGQAVIMAGGPRSPGARAAVRLQEQALEIGAVRLVGLPFEIDDRAADLSFASLTALHDHLLLDGWRKPPPFVLVADPVVARAEIREGRYDEGGITTREAVRIGRALDVDFVAMGDILSFSVRETDVKSTPQTARIRDGSVVTYHRVTGRLTLDMTVRLTLIDVGRGRSVETQRFTVSRGGNFERASYSGDPSELRVSRSVRNLFAPGRMPGLRQDLADRVVEEAAGRFAQRTFREILRRVP